MMWPILVLSVFSFAVMAERFIVFTTRRFPAPEKFFQMVDSARLEGDTAALSRAEEECPAYVPLFRALLSESEVEAAEREAQFAGEEILFAMRRRLDFLATAASAAPLMGLLGTVLGMISAFSRMSASGNVDITMLAGGIWQALLTTAAGLAVALPCLLAHRWFCRQLDKNAFVMQHAVNRHLAGRTEDS